MTTELLHWGMHAAEALRGRGVDTIFTLSGGHIFLLYDGARQVGIRLVDVRHEQTAGFAAEAWARLTRGPGVAAVTAGPGVFNTVNAVATAAKNGSPLCVLGGRAPGWRWGRGSLQEVDHVPVMAPLSKEAFTAGPDLLARLSGALGRIAAAPRGPLFLDVPLDLQAEGTAGDADRTPPARVAPDLDAVRRVAAQVSRSERPVLVAGSNVWADGAHEALRAFAEGAAVPVFSNGMGRGTLPPGHRLQFSRARGLALREADLVIVAGTPVDFRLGFGDTFPAGAPFVHLESHPSLLAAVPVPTEAIGADLELVFRALEAEGSRANSAAWCERLRGDESSREAVAAQARGSDRDPIHPMRVYGEIGKVLEPDATVVCDGGDFVSYAGREILSHRPGSFLDPGPLGCLGAGPGQALAAALLRPGRQTLLLLGDGSFGFAGLEFDTFVRHRLPVVAVLGNNGMWALEKHLMRQYFGWDTVADLNPETRYDRVAEALGAHGELVERPDRLGPALRRAFDAGGPALVQVRIDPAVVYPRNAELF